jgi:hypothetical protein
VIAHINDFEENETAIEERNQKGKAKIAQRTSFCLRTPVARAMETHTFNGRHKNFHNPSNRT